MGNSNRNNSNNRESNHNRAKKDKEKEDFMKPECLVDYKFIVQKHFKSINLTIPKFESINLNELKSLIYKKLNFKIIPIERIILFYREPDKLGYKLINSEESLKKLKNNDIIKIEIFPEDTPEDKEDYERIITNLTTSLEIEDTILDDYIIRFKEALINITPGNNEYDNFISIISNKNKSKEKHFPENTTEQQTLIMNLFSKIFESHGTKTLIDTYKDNSIFTKKSLQKICSGYSEMKKFEFHFKTKNNLLLENTEEYYFFTEKLRKNLSKKLSIPSEDICFGPPIKGSIIVPVVFLREKIKNLNFEEIRRANQNLEELININKFPLLEYIQLDRGVFDPRYNNNDDDKWGKDEIRGKEKYIPPKGWIGLGLNVEDSYDNGEACWLCFGGIYENEYAIAYYPITEEDDDIFFEKDFQNNNEFDYLNLISNSINLKSGERNLKTGKGTILYQNIQLAEKQATLIDIDNNYNFKIVLMCRVNPKKIRSPTDYKEVWVLDKNSEEIRPYRILVKLFDKNENAGKPPKNFYQYYSLSKAFYECLSKKDESLFQEENIQLGFTPVEYPIYLYKDNSGALTEYLLFKRAENPLFPEERVQSWVYCLYKVLTDKSLKTDKMDLVENNTIVYSGVHIDQCALNEEFKIGRRLYFGKFLSTSLDKEKAKEFTFGNGFLFIITIKNNEENNYCYNIEKFAVVNNEGYEDAEREILITAFALFQITNIVKGNDITEIYMDCFGFENLSDDNDSN